MKSPWVKGIIAYLGGLVAFFVVVLAVEPFRSVVNPLGDIDMWGYHVDASGAAMHVGRTAWFVVVETAGGCFLASAFVGAMMGKRPLMHAMIFAAPIAALGIPATVGTAVSDAQSPWWYTVAVEAIVVLPILVGCVAGGLFARRLQKSLSPAGEPRPGDEPSAND